MFKKLFFWVFALVGCQSAFAATAVIEAVPTDWIVRWYPSEATDGADGELVIANTGATFGSGSKCGGASNPGQLTFMVEPSPATRRLFYSTILAAKISQTKVYVTYDNSLCTILTFGPK